jgi:MFS family permease
VAPTAWVAAVLLVGVGMAMMLFMATANTTLQLNSDAAMRGRVMALYGLLFAGSTPLGGPVMGWISEAWGPRVGMAIGGALSLAAALAAVSRVRIRRRAEALAPGEAHETPDIAVA